MARMKSGLRFQPSGGSKSNGLPVDKRQRLRIERLIEDGRGLAHAEGRTWFVSGALADEEVDARVLSVRGKIVEANAEQVHVPSHARRAAPCDKAGRCGGCSLQHLGHGAQLQLKQQRLAGQLQRQAGLQPLQWSAPLFAGELAYRRRARLAVYWDRRRNALDLGFRASASREIVEIGACPVLVEPLQQVAALLPALFRQVQHPEQLGHLELLQGTASALLVRHIGALVEADRQLIRDFCMAQGLQLWWQGQGEPEPDRPEQRLSYRLPEWNLELACRPGDFIQVNERVNQAMIAQALEWLAIEPHERVLDLFCGLGNFALPLAQQAREVIAVEGVMPMVLRAEQNARANGLHNVHFFRADLAEPFEQQPWAKEGFAAILLDPPRDGALEVVRHIARLGARRILYVSCNPDTLARDALLLAGHGYRMTRGGILDMFPQTAHVEAMVLFELA